MYMEVTSEQRKNLLHTGRTADHMFNWVYTILQQDSVSVKQYNILMKILVMHPQEQLGYIIHQDTLYSVPRRVKKYQKTVNGWKLMNRFTAGPKGSRIDKKE